ncbi:Endonuclease/exonuclease/phosphatase [Dichotomocladium elegans]|nr:Endonuclease/exonuclease/phosphatase [Dichotomocladium elegans]
MFVAPGDLLEYDFRPSAGRQLPSVLTSLKVVQWNVERNYESQAIITILKELDCDVCILQEVDMFCKRSGCQDHFRALCEELQVKGGFVAEFLELESPIRQPRDQGGGSHGNAILSKYDVDFSVVKHQYHAYDWDHDGEKLREPRKGKRYTLAATVKAPGLPPIRCYSVHLEVFTGIIGRITSFSEVFEDSRAHFCETPYQIIGGDLNTMAHSIARVSGKYATDRYRWLSLGETESGWWHRRVFAFHDQDGQWNTSLAGSVIPFFAWVPAWIYLWTSGFGMEVLKRARNPGFYDPWPCEEVTLENPAYFGLFKAKLDWTLLRCLEVIRQGVGNADYRASDHKYLMVEVKPSDPNVDPYKLWQQQRHQWGNHQHVAITAIYWKWMVATIAIGSFIYLTISWK